MAGFDPLFSERWRQHKCCTFQPFFPNFYLGAILNDSPRDLASKQVHLGPLGMIATQDFRALCNSTAEGLKGQSHHCTFFDSTQRRCTVWNLRPGECSTYYCRPKGIGAQLSQMTFAVESAVAQMAMVELGYSDIEVSQEVETLNSGVRQRIWDHTELLDVYQRAWRWSLNLTPEQIQQWLDFDILGRVAP